MWSSLQVVKAVVDVATRAGVLLLAPVDVGVRLVVEKVAEDGGEAALRGVHGLGRILGDLLAEAEVHVRIDEAREYVQALRALLRDPGRRACAGLEQGGDASRLDQDVAALGLAVGEHHRAAPQYEIAHAFSLSVFNA
jgi:hypothetical protein